MTRFGKAKSAIGGEDADSSVRMRFECARYRPPRQMKMTSHTLVSLAFLVSVSLVVPCQTETRVKVTTKRGEIIGLEENVTLPDGTRHTLNVFRGVPYALPPVGRLRFSKPQPAPNFSEPFQAFHFGPACPQQHPFAANKSEDCLTLNIYAPKPTAQNPPLPVIVWLHGGGFFFGEGRQLPGENLASFGNIIVVTMNFRIGALGFLATDDATAPGNWGLWDQRLALQWVSENIQHFNGDPGNITLAGTTSGAICVTYHALFPRNAGLFRRILVESGTAVSVSGYRTKGFPYAKAVANKLGCDVPESAPDPSGRIIECLREKDFQSILEADVKPNQPFSFTWIPVVDREFIADVPSTVLSWPPSGSPLLANLGAVDALIGTTSSDGSILMKIFVKRIAASMNESVISGVSRALFEKSEELLVNSSEGSVDDIVSAEVRDAVKRAVLQEYTDWEKPMESGSRGRGLVSLLTDKGFYIPSAVFTRNLARLKNSSATFMYEFNQRSLSRAPYSWLEGSLHKDHDVFVLGFPESFPALGGPLDVHSANGSALWNFSKTVMTYWSNFVKTGNPNSPESVPADWPPFTLANEDYLHLEVAETAARRHVRARRTAFWFDYIPKLKSAFRGRKSECKQDDGTNESAAMSFSLHMRFILSVGYLAMYCNRFL